MKDKDPMKEKVEISLNEDKEKKIEKILDNTLSSLLQMAQVMKITLFTIEEPLLFQPLQIFIKYLKNEYGDFGRDDT